MRSVTRIGENKFNLKNIEMKDIKYCMMALLAMLFTAASCSEDETLAEGG